MDSSRYILRNEEKAVFALRSLYQKYGYRQYKMSKFEEYDLYVRNKDFLVSDHIITFTDTDGKLMALKPDVTLSIIKNSKELPGVQKVYYNENVYRVSKGSLSFKEIMQAGLECIGDIDAYCIFEVLMLAAKSLESISPHYILDISHLGLVSSLIDELNPSAEVRQELLKCIGERNLHGISEICSREALDDRPLRTLASSYGSPKRVIAALRELKLGAEGEKALNELEQITSALESAGFDRKVYIDFSVINDMNYYNGIVFKGFINGIPNGVLSGGQYDKLMRKLGRKADAIGFAVYLDMLERLAETKSDCDVDAVIIYDETSSLVDINRAVSKLTTAGKSVIAQKSVPSGIQFRQLFRLREGALEAVEQDA